MSVFSVPAVVILMGCQSPSDESFWRLRIAEKAHEQAREEEIRRPIRERQMAEARRAEYNRRLVDMARLATEEATASTADAKRLKKLRSAMKDVEAMWK